MKKIFLYIFILPFILTGKLVAIDARKISELSLEINECSGLIFLNGELIAHNDSANEAILYVINPSTGIPERKVIVENILNKDIEDITFDDEFIYLADFGNNGGNRTDLVIYKISIFDFERNDTVNAELIKFSYKNQLDFSNQTYSTNFDAEALISKGENLYLFSKNWGNLKTYIYTLPKEIGEYEVEIIDSLDVGGLITGAEYDEKDNEIILIGYTTTPFYVKLTDLEFPLLSRSKFKKENLTVSGSIQIEGIANYEMKKYFICSEKFILGGKSTLSSLDINVLSNISKQLENHEYMSYDFQNSVLRVNYEFSHNIQIYDLLMKSILSSKMNSIDLSLAPSGVYLAFLSNLNNSIIDEMLIYKK